MPHGNLNLMQGIVHARLLFCLELQDPTLKSVKYKTGLISTQFIFCKKVTYNMWQLVRSYWEDGTVTCHGHLWSLCMYPCRGKPSQWIHVIFVSRCNRMEQEHFKRWCCFHISMQCLNALQASVGDIMCMAQYTWALGTRQDRVGDMCKCNASIPAGG